MTSLQEYIRARACAGKSLSAVIVELAGVVCTAERTVWRWYEANKAPAYAERLLRVWDEATPEQRASWFA